MRFLIKCRGYIFFNRGSCYLVLSFVINLILILIFVIRNLSLGLLYLLFLKEKIEIYIFIGNVLIF